MNSYTTRPLLLEKEEVIKLFFPKDPVDRGESEFKSLRKKLVQATSLGNLHHTKVRIIFKDSIGLKEVRTTIWATGQRHIVLKSGMTMPIRRIVDVIL